MGVENKKQKKKEHHCRLIRHRWLAFWFESTRGVMSTADEMLGEDDIRRGSWNERGSDDDGAGSKSLRAFFFDYNIVEIVFRAFSFSTFILRRRSEFLYDRGRF